MALTADETAPGFDFLPSEEHIKTYLSLCKVPQAVRCDCVGKRKDRSSCSGSFFLRANDKFSDNRHVLIDVSTLLIQTTSGFHQGNER